MHSAPSEAAVAYVVASADGLESFLYREAAALTRRGCRLQLCATRYGASGIWDPKSEWSVEHPTPWRVLTGLLPLTASVLVRPRLIAHALRNGTAIDLVLGAFFFRRLRRRRIAAVHSTFGDHKLFVGYYLSRILDVPLSTAIHAHELSAQPNGRAFRDIIRRCDIVLPVANQWREILVEEYGVEPGRCRLQRLWVPEEPLPKMRPVTVLVVGRYTHRKGHHILMEALSQVTAHTFRCVCIGWGDVDVKALARQWGVDDRVVVFGRMSEDQLRVVYCAGDVLCLPSIETREEGTEGVPVVLMEAMAVGLPVVASRVGAVSELVEEGLVPPGDPGALAQALVKLIETPQLRREQGDRNRARVSERFSEANVDQLAASLQALSNRGG